MKSSFAIAGSMVGDGQPCFVIAEAGVNHNGDPDLALGLVDAAAAAGADAIKFQTFSADTLVSRSAPQFPYALSGDLANVTQHEMLRRLELSHDMHEPIRRRCVEHAVLFLSTPFHESDADWLDDFGVPAFKISSGEITNLPFIRHVAAKGKPLILSTGMATMGEVDSAVQAVVAEGNGELVLLHCVSDYPADPADANLRAMDTMRRAFGVPVGFSDHTPGIEVSLAAVALGAALIEKHFTLDRNLPGPDHMASLDPGALTDLVAGIRVVEVSLGTGVKRPVTAELKNQAVVRKSVVAARKLSAGQLILPDMLDVRRPGDGLPPEMRQFLVGRRLAREVEEGALISLDDLS